MEPRDKDRDQFDQLLDSALRQYGNVEPRPGLEGRVLATLAANSGRSRARSVWAWGLAGAAAMVVVIGMWIESGHHRPNTPVAVVQPIVSDGAAQKTTLLTPPAELNKPAVRRVPSRQTAAPATMAKAAEPRLGQFPSRRPLAQQDLVVAEYVQRFPEEAMLIVQEQKRFDDEIQQAQQEVESDYRNSNNQER